MLWYIDEFQEVPEGFGVLTNKTILSPGINKLCVQSILQYFYFISTRILYCTEIRVEDLHSQILQTTILSSNGNIIVKLSVTSSECNLWHELLNNHANYISSNIPQDKIKDLLSENEFDNGKQKPITSTIQIHLKGQPHIIHIKPDDNVALVADTFVKEHNLKPEIQPKIETELLRTQVDACRLLQNKLRRHIANIRKRVVDIVIAEEKVAISEEHSLKLLQSLERYEILVPEIERKFANLHHSIKEK